MANVKAYPLRTVIGCTLMGILVGMACQYPTLLWRSPETTLHKRLVPFAADADQADRVGLELRHSIVKANNLVPPGTPLVLRAELVRLPKP